jgi:hypothetical protein
MMGATLTIICDVIILVAAVCVAIANIYKFFASGGKKVKDKIDENRAEQLQAEKMRTRETITEVNTEQEAARKEETIKVLREVLPGMLVDHDLKLREKYKADREQYLLDIKEAVVREIQTQLNAVDNIQCDMEALAESAKDVLREKIMALYHKNKRSRTMEEHEKEALTQYYKDYKAIGGNSYIDKYYGRMSTWDVIPDDYIDE